MIARKATLAVAAALVLAGSRAPAAAGATRRILYFTQNVGGGHATVPVGLKVLRELGARSGAFAVDECADCRKWSDAYFAPYAAMASFGSGELPLTDANKRAFLDFVRGGKGFVGIHSAIRVCQRRRWPEYEQMLGGALLNSLWQQRVRVTVEDRIHPATRHLGAWFHVQDEIYQFTRWDREKTHVLLSVDTRSVNLFDRNVRRKDRDFAVAWCHPYGKGRVLYTTLGHGHAVWRDPLFHGFLLGAVRWAMGDLPAKARLGTDGRIWEVLAPHDAPRLVRAPQP